MICEKCKQEHDGSFGSGRFCSRKCSNSRSWTEEDKKKKSEAGKKSVKVLEKNKINGLKKKGIRPFTDEQIQKGAEAQRKKWEGKYNSFLKEGKYELLGYNFRRKILLKEANNSCEVCNNSNWLNKPIWLEVHHKDGNKKNNVRGNLIVVCLNCHSAIDDKYRFTGRINR